MKMKMREINKDEKKDKPSLFTGPEYDGTVSEREQLAWNVPRPSFLLGPGSNRSRHDALPGTC